MARLRTNIAANYAGKVWLALMSLAFVPIYIRFLGIEAYGLIGIYLSLQSLFSLLDLGLSTTLNRELARLSGKSGHAQEMRDLVHTLQIIYWGVAFMIGIGVVLLAPLVAHHWVKAEHLSPNVINQTIIIMGLSIALQWPYALYYGGLIGLQRQVLLNGIVITLATIRALGAVFILWKVSPTIQAFFFWQMMISLAQTLAAGDKVVLSRILPLQSFGNYTLAGTVAGGLSFFIAPVFDGIFPRFSQLASLQDTHVLADLYHRSCQLVSVIILPMAVVISFFAFPLLYVWTGNLSIALHTHWILSFLVMGSAFNCIMNLPYALQLAYGWTRLAFLTNLIASILLIPLIIFLAYRYGAIGGALVWLLLNSGYVLISIQIMHKRILPAEKWRWYFLDVGLPFLAAASTAGLLKLLLPTAVSRWPILGSLVLVSGVTLSVTAMVTPASRNLVFQFLAKWRGVRLEAGSYL